MLAFALLSVCLAAPELRIAPDQPSSYIFADEPLILEFSRFARESIHPKIVSIAPDGTETVHEPRALRFRNGKPRWLRLDLTPPQYGPHAIEVRLPDSGFVARGTFQRIRRPAPKTSAGLVARSGRWGNNALTYIRSVPVRTATLNMTQADWVSTAERLHDSNIQVRLRIPADYVENNLELEWPAELVHWVVVPYAKTASSWIEYARGLKSHAPAARIVLESDDPSELLSVLRAGGHGWIDEVDVYDAEALVGHRKASEKQGYEGLAYSIRDAGSTPEQVARRLLGGASRVDFDLRLVYENDMPTSGLSRWNAFASIFGGAVPAGFIRNGQEDGDGFAIVFRLGNADGGPTWAAISTDSSVLRGEPFGSASTLLDEFGNAIKDPSRLDGARMAHGTTGTELAHALALSIREETAFIAAQEPLRALLTDAINRAIDRLLSCDGSGSQRTEFFALLQSIPLIESAWHREQIPKQVAVPTLASIERLALHLGRLEQALELPFLEPIEETLSRCSEHQTRYLAKAGGSGAYRERGDWLLEHVSDLMADARSLDAQGHGIEADALAALAEWRARSLEHAVNARPLTLVEAEPVTDSDSADTEPEPTQ